MKYLFIILFLASCTTLSEIPYHESPFEFPCLVYEDSDVLKANRSFDKLQKLHYAEFRFLLRTDGYFVILLVNGDIITDNQKKYFSVYENLDYQNFKKL